MTVCLNSFPSRLRKLDTRSLTSLFDDPEVSFSVFPFRVLIRKIPSISGFRILIVVPKRKISTAVARNRIKRMMKECVRHRKNYFLPRTSYAVIYTGNGQDSMETLDNAFDRLLESKKLPRN